MTWSLRLADRLAVGVHAGKVPPALHREIVERVGNEMVSNFTKRIGVAESLNIVSAMSERTAQIHGTDEYKIQIVRLLLGRFAADHPVSAQLVALMKESREVLLPDCLLRESC